MNKLVFEREGSFYCRFCKVRRSELQEVETKDFHHSYLWWCPRHGIVGIPCPWTEVSRKISSRGGGRGV